MALNAKTTCRVSSKVRPLAIGFVALTLVACHSRWIPRQMQFREAEPGVCHGPLAEACVAACPDYRAVATDFFGPTSPLVACAASKDVLVHRTTCDGYRSIEIGGGYTSVTDWFDPSGAMIGEERFTDDGGEMVCNGESGVYGLVPICPDGHLVDDGAFCGDRDKVFARGPLWRPAWRNVANGKKAEPCGCAPSDPICGCWP